MQGGCRKAARESEGGAGTLAAASTALIRELRRRLSGGGQPGTRPVAKAHSQPEGPCLQGPGEKHSSSALHWGRPVGL